MRRIERGFTVGCLASFHFAVDADPLALWSDPCAVHCALRVAHGVAPYARCAALDAVPYELCAALDAVPCVLRAVPHDVACPSAEWSPCRSGERCWAAGLQHPTVVGPWAIGPSSTRPAPKWKKPFGARSFPSHFFQSRSTSLLFDCGVTVVSAVPSQPIVVATIVVTAHFIPSLSGLTLNNVNGI